MTLVYERWFKVQRHTMHGNSVATATYWVRAWTESEATAVFRQWLAGGSDRQLVASRVTQGNPAGPVDVIADGPDDFRCGGIRRPCEQGCGAVATVYALDPSPGGWGGYYCLPCANALGFQVGSDAAELP